MPIKRKIKRKKRSKKQSRPPEHAAWSKLVRKRDKYICCECGCADKKVLHAHHIKDWESHPDLRYNVDNGKTLCAICHAKEHPEYAHLILKLHRVKTSKAKRVVKRRKSLEE